MKDIYNMGFARRSRKKKRKSMLAKIFVLFFLLGAGVVLYEVGTRWYAKVTYVPPPPPEPREEVKITVIEGWTLFDIAEMLEAKGLATEKEFFDFVGVPADTSRPGYEKSDLMKTYPYLEEIPAGVSLEGYLFPDTYRVFADEGVESIVGRLIANFDRKFDADMRAEVEAQNKTMYEIVTMASIVEKEVRTDPDRPKVADVLWGRLRVGMGLQVDSSVNYVTGKNDPGVTRKDSRVDSPYNTYRYRGLPLGPISNPGLKSLQASIYPTETPYTYFLTDLEGNVHYARTHDEHVANKFKYLK